MCEMKKKIAIVILPKLLLIIIFKIIQVGYTKNIATLRLQFNSERVTILKHLYGNDGILSK